MTTQPLNSGLVVNEQRSGNTVTVNDTFWGYVIRPGRKVINRAATGELVATAISVLLLLAAYAQWLLPGSNSGQDVLLFKVVGTAVFFILAFVLYLIARRGLCYEFQVDTQQREVRTARRNRNGSSTQIEAIPFAAISSAFMKRSKSPFLPDRLYVRLTTDQSAIEVASGIEAELEPVLQRLMADLRGQAAPATAAAEKSGSRGGAKRARSAFAAR